MKTTAVEEYTSKGEKILHLVLLCSRVPRKLKIY